MISQFLTRPIFLSLQSDHSLFHAIIAQTWLEFSRRCFLLFLKLDSHLEMNFFPAIRAFDWIHPISRDEPQRPWFKLGYATIWSQALRTLHSNNLYSNGCSSPLRWKSRTRRRKSTVLNVLTGNVDLPTKKEQQTKTSRCVRLAKNSKHREVIHQA